MKKLILLLLTLLLAMPAMPALTEQPAITPADLGLTASGYVNIYVAVSDQEAWYALPAEGEDPYEVTIRWVDLEGNEFENVVCITPEGAYMLRSNCDNQDCVGEGMVTLENKELRILGNWIICLPHQVSVELYSAQEVLELMLSMTNTAQ